MDNIAISTEQTYVGMSRMTIKSPKPGTQNLNLFKEHYTLP